MMQELEELRETTSSSYLDQTKCLRLALEEKQKQLDSLSTSNAELQNSIKDLDERLRASKQSRADADEIISRYSALPWYQFLTISQQYKVLDIYISNTKDFAHLSMLYLPLHEGLISLRVEMFPARKQLYVNLRDS